MTNKKHERTLAFFFPWEFLLDDLWRLSASVDDDVVDDGDFASGTRGRSPPPMLSSTSA